MNEQVNEGMDEQIDAHVYSGVLTVNLLSAFSEKVEIFNNYDLQ